MDTMHYYMEGHCNPEPKKMERQEQLGDYFIYSKEFLLTFFFLVFLLILLSFSNTMLGYFVRRLAAFITNPLSLLTVFCVIAFSFLAVAESSKDSREFIASFNVGAQLYDEVVRPIVFYGQPIAPEVMLPRQAFVGEDEYVNQEIIYERGSYSHTANWETSGSGGGGGGGNDNEVEMEQRVEEAVQEVEPVNEVEEEQREDEAVQKVEVEPSEEAETENRIDGSEDMEENSCNSRTFPIDYIEMEEFNGFIGLYILYRRSGSFQYLEYMVSGYLAMLY